MKENFEFNIRHAFILGLAIDRKCAKTIDEIYYKDEKIYHDSYLKEGLSDDYLKKMFTMETEDRMNKLSGIIQVNLERNNLLTIEKIIKNLHPSIINFVKKSAVVDLDKFLRTYNINLLSESENFSIGISLMFLSYQYGKEFIGDSYIYFVVEKWKSLVECLNATHHYKKINGYVEKDPGVLENIDKTYKLFNLDRSKIIDCNLEDFFSDYLESETYKLLGVDNYKDISKISQITISEYESARHLIFEKNGIAGYIGSLSRYLKTLGLNETDIFMDTHMNDEVLENIMRDFTWGKLYNGVTEDDRGLYIVSCLFIYNLVEIYKKCKDLYLNKLLEDKYKEVLALENEIESRKDEFNSKINDYKNKIKESKQENNELKNRIKQLEKENARLTGAYSKNEEMISDLTSENTELKATVEELKGECERLSENNNDDTLSIEEKIDFINSHKISVFGGMKSIKTISEKLNNVVFYNELNQDISSILNTDMVFVSYEFFNHAFTNKVKSVLSGSNVPLRYISGTNNELIINNIYNELKNFEKIND